MNQEIIIQIASYLDKNEIVDFLGTTSSLHKYFNDEGFWKMMYLNVFKEPMLHYLNDIDWRTDFLAS